MDALKTFLRLLWLLVPRFLKAHDRAADDAAEAAVAKGDRAKVNAEFKDLLRTWPIAFLALGASLLSGCSLGVRTVVIRADEEMVPLVPDEEPGHYRIPSEGQPCDGWYVPNAMLLRIRSALKDAAKE